MDLARLERHKQLPFARFLVKVKNKSLFLKTNKDFTIVFMEDPELASYWVTTHRLYANLLNLPKLEMPDIEVCIYAHVSLFKDLKHQPTKIQLQSLAGNNFFASEIFNMKNFILQDEYLYFKHYSRKSFHQTFPVIINYTPLG